MRFPVKALTRGQLEAIAYPQSAGQPEAIPWVFYDTRSYVSAATQQLTFFQTTQAGDLSNMQAAGQLPDPQWFQAYYFTLDVLNRPSQTADNTGSLDDLVQLLLAGRGRWLLTLQDKQYGPFPLSTLGSSSELRAAISSDGAAAANAFQYGSADPDGTFCWDGSLVIPPKVGFNIQLVWPAALTLEEGDTNLRFNMHGTLYRSVK